MYQLIGAGRAAVLFDVTVPCIQALVGETVLASEQPYGPDSRRQFAFGPSQQETAEATPLTVWSDYQPAKLGLLASYPYSNRGDESFLLTQAPSQNLWVGQFLRQLIE